MDLATLLGMLGAMAIVAAAIFTGGSVPVFFNVPSILIVIGGTLLTVMVKFSLKQFLGAFKVAGRAFSSKAHDPEQLIQEIVNLANIGRKEGLLSLEKAEISEPFLQEGIRMLVDGTNQEVVKSVMNRDMQQTIDRHNWGEKVFRATGDVAPAMGMIGTLIGLVQMLSNMSDPKAIGPAMAVALLTTLYGAVLANMIALPIADKLHLRKSNEKTIHAMCIDGVLAIQAGQNPRIIESMLKAYLDPSQRDKSNGKGK
jgi:chemotaxis protein MotA